MKLRSIGFWPREYDIDPPYYLLRDNTDYCGLKIADYLKSGFKLRGWQGYSFCRFRCGIPDSKMGVWDQTDGTWVWPEGFAHYIEFHHIDIPKEFIRHIVEADYQLKISTDIEKMLVVDKKKFEQNPSNPSLLEYDQLFWIEWLSQKRLESLGKTENIVVAKYSEEKNGDNLFEIPDDDSFLRNT